MPSGKSSRQWLREHFSDPYVRQAHQEGYRSRAAYKLLELDQRYRLFRKGDIVVDLGAAPGGWSQVAAQLVGHQGKVFALDRLPMKPIDGVDFVQGDFSDSGVAGQLEAMLGGKKVNLVMCDIAPDLSGINTVDQIRAMALCELALDFACGVLDERGCFIVKAFQGEGFEPFLKELRKNFSSVMIRKPDASRSRSREVYLLAGCDRKQHNLRKAREFHGE